MAAGQTQPTANHLCGCGKAFETTEELLAHAREEHGFWAY